MGKSIRNFVAKDMRDGFRSSKNFNDQNSSRRANDARNKSWQNLIEDDLYDDEEDGAFDMSNTCDDVNPADLEEEARNYTEYLLNK